MSTRILGLVEFAECLAVGLACGDQCSLTGSGSALEALRDDALYKFTYFTFTLSGRAAGHICCCALVSHVTGVQVRAGKCCAVC